MNSAIEQTKIIQALLTFPEQAAKILAVHPNLIDHDLVKMVEQRASDFQANGSQEAATFLHNLVPHLNQLINNSNISSLKTRNIEGLIVSDPITEPDNISQQQTQAYRHLIQALLTYPDQTTRLLDAHQNLLDEYLVEMTAQLAASMKANGSREAAIFLCNLVVRLKNHLSAPPEIVDYQPNNPKVIAQTPPKNRLKLLSSVTLMISFLILAINHQFGGNKFLSLPQVLATDSLESGLNNKFQDSILPVETISIEPVNSYKVSRNYTGQILANRSSELSFELSGKLISQTVKEGDYVKIGTTLASLNIDNLRTRKQELLARKAQAVAQLKELRAGARPETIAAARAVVADFQEQLKLESQRRLRRKELYEEGAISREQFEEVVTAESSLQARLNEAQSRLDELLAGTRPERIEAQEAVIRELDANIANINIELKKSVLKAPFAGTISSRQVDEGTVVSAGQSVFSLVEDSILEAHIGIPIDQSQQITVGKTLPVGIGQDVYQAKVSSLLPELDANTRTVTAVLALENTARKIFPGQIVRLPISQTVTNSGFWLPTTALVRGERGLWFCYVIGEPIADDNTTATKSIFQIERRTIEVLHNSNNRVLVRGTLQPGEKVIANGTHRLVPEQLVTLK
ncbi:MAG: efflux RND transporter periplasmic adaptor subunit [Xenococcus sp. MO_188.B8]|nr:efflux RND transporter periplasmic adaptor subunit [Xenococcus sp. MO_188.B8]